MVNPAQVLRISTRAVELQYKMLIQMNLNVNLNCLKISRRLTYLFHKDTWQFCRRHCSSFTVGWC